MAAERKDAIGEPASPAEQSSTASEASDASEQSKPAASDAGMDEAIAEYDAAVKPASNDAEPDAQPTDGDPDLQQEAIAALRGMDAPQVDPALDALRGENASLRAHITRQAEEAEFKQLADSVQRQLPDHLP